jgi:hypothetical protein
VTRALAAAFAALLVGCAGVQAAESSHDAFGALLGSGATRSTGTARPPVTTVVRDGDARGAVAVAVSTEGIDADRGALAGVALAALVQQRMASAGVEVTAVGGWNGWSLRALADSTAHAQSVVAALRAALLTPVTAGDPALPAVTRRTNALAARRLADNALIDAARCSGEAMGLRDVSPPTPAELETWRIAAHGLRRVAIATAGAQALADAVVEAIGQGPVWPEGAPRTPSPWPDASSGAAIYDASGTIEPGSARITVTARTASPERAVAAAPLLADSRGPLATRLGGIGSQPQLRSVIATAHTDGGCLVATVDIGESALGADAAEQIATTATLVRQEMTVEMGDVTAPAGLGFVLARQAADPAEAAQRAAWWALADRRPDVTDEEVRTHLMVGVAASRDASASPTDAIRREIDKATLAWHAPVAEARIRVEQGQGEMWIWVGSTCGTLPEADEDAGLSAFVALSAAEQSVRDAGDAQIEPYLATDAVGLLVHGPMHPGETAQAHARRLADLAGRAFLADAITPGAAARARSRLMMRQSTLDAQVYASLAGALAPGHPSWVDADGTQAGLASASDEAVAIRADVIRKGPIMVAVLANVDKDQGDAAARAVDRWIARRPGEWRSCPATPLLPPPRSGTYSVDAPIARDSEVWLAVPLPRRDPAAIRQATWLAAALSGPDGLLAQALGGSKSSAAIRAGTWAASVIGAPFAPALAVRIVAPDDRLDTDVAQVRSLFERLGLGKLEETDRARAAARIANDELRLALDPRVRTVRLWHAVDPSSAPPLQALRTFAETWLRDPELIVVAGRPQRWDSGSTETEPRRGE